MEERLAFGLQESDDVERILPLTRTFDSGAFDNRTGP